MQDLLKLSSGNRTCFILLISSSASSSLSSRFLILLFSSLEELTLRFFPANFSFSASILICNSGSRWGWSRGRGNSFPGSFSSIVYIFVSIKETVFLRFLTSSISSEEVISIGSSTYGLKRWSWRGTTVSMISFRRRDLIMRVMQPSDLTVKFFGFWKRKRISRRVGIE